MGKIIHYICGYVNQSMGSEREPASTDESNRAQSTISELDAIRLRRRPDLRTVSICDLFIQFARYEIAHRAFAEIEVPVWVGEGTVLGILLEAFEDCLYAEILCLADILESCMVAGEVVGALHPLHDLLDLTLMLSMHAFSYPVYLGALLKIMQVTYQISNYYSIIIICT